MSLIAGIDIGNSTTEIVIQRGGVPVAWHRRPTRGQKGSPGSVRAAAAMLRAMEEARGIRADRVVVAPWRPVTTDVACVAEPPPDTGRIRVLDCATHSICGDGAVAGSPWDVRAPAAGDQPVIAVVPSDVGFRQAVSRIGDALARGCPVAGVVAARDEAVLIASRLQANVPVIDGVDTDRALHCTALFVEARAAGQCVRTATDAWALKAMLRLSDADENAVSLVTRWVRDERAAVIGVAEAPAGRAAGPAVGTLTWLSGETCGLFDAVERVAAGPVGAVRAYSLSRPIAVSDLYAVDLTATVAARGVRAPGHSRELVLASLAGADPEVPAGLEEVFGVAVDVAGSEAEAGWRGARTTPGLGEGALVLDIGGGTIDLVGDGAITAAGGGEMLTAAVARVLGVPRGAADWIKRGAARRVESPRVLLNEDGSRHFAADDQAVALARMVGTLVAPGPSGYTSFGGALQPAEWRIVRQSLKLDVIAGNVGRVLATFARQCGGSERLNVVVVGGPAGDDELLPVIGRLEGVSACGRGNVAGCLGHRYAVAYGLATT